MSDSAIATVVSGVTTVVITVVGFLTLWVKLKYGVQKAEEAAVNTKRVESKTEEVVKKTDEVVKKADEAAESAKRVEDKVDDNTRITIAGKEEAKAGREAAASVADQLNGAMDERITRIVRNHTEPLLIAFREHNEQDQKNMERIEMVLKDLSSKIK